MSATVTNLAAHVAAKAKAKQAELDRAVMARAAHLKVKR